MAEDIFKSNQFPLKSHRDIILNWFCGLDNNEVNDSCWIDSVKKCFESTFPYSSLDSSLIENLIEVHDLFYFDVFIKGDIILFTFYCR